MTLTELETKVFQDLRGTNTGKVLALFVEKLVTQVCDVRVGDYPPEARLVAAQVLSKELVQRLRAEKEEALSKSQPI